MVGGARIVHEPSTAVSRETRPRASPFVKGTVGGWGVPAADSDVHVIVIDHIVPRTPTPNVIIFEIVAVSSKAVTTDFFNSTKMCTLEHLESWSARVGSLTSRAGELRSAPSEPDDRYRVTG